MKHFTLNEYQNARVNKLHEAFNDLLGAESNRIVDKDVFIKELKKKVEELNAKFPRCRPLDIDFWQPFRPKNETYILSCCHYGVSFKLLPVKES